MNISQKQIKHFEKLTEALMSPACVKDGLDHRQFYGIQKTTYRVSKRLAKGLIIEDRLRYNRQEIVIEADNESWGLNYHDGNKIKDYLDKNNIPYTLIITGGKGLRFHIFLSQKVLEQNWIFYLYAYICDKIDLDWKTHGVPENKSTNHLLGCIGKKSLKEDYGWYATHSNIIPEQRPKTLSHEVVFPSEIKTWNLPTRFLNMAIIFSKTIPKSSTRATMQNFRYRALLVLK